MTFEVPEHIRPLRDQVYEFITELVEPAEDELHAGDAASRAKLAELQAEAKRRGLWALGHPKDIGGGGLPFLDYVYINEVQGRSEYGQLALGTWTLQDSIMLNLHASPRWREKYLAPMVNGEISPSFAMTEPGIAGSDPTGLQTSAVLDGDEWVINGRKWFTTGAGIAAYTTVMCRTEPDAPAHSAFSMIIVPTDNPGYRLVRDTPVLGMESGHYEVEYDNVRVPAENLLGERGNGFVIAQERLGPGRIFHAMRWLGQAQRAFDLMCNRLTSRVAFGEPLADKQLMQQHVFESYTEIQASRLLTLKAAEAIDRGDQARVEIAAIKVHGARMLHNVIDRAVQVYGAEGITDDTPLSRMYREARFARLYDGPDEVHISTVGRRVLKEYRAGGNWEFGLR
ncbi:MAG: acyl-CoA dehydrogenase family protein [Gordonia sp. (in: high G+C Gram-positive bacteria)]|uniref:acyl-CoA dehydrogenase family protein n=1 Tax=Gordonia sp. (in: high G+C Gram-positive bacteria) TaxID=84139 RepID=UPI003C743FF3